MLFSCQISNAYSDSVAGSRIEVKEIPRDYTFGVSIADFSGKVADALGGG